MALRIRLTKQTDGTVALTCRRADGTATWQRQAGAHARFFPYHDLTHYAVETVLAHRHGFYGLVADGWDMTDFGSPWPRGPLPADAEPTEWIVGLFDLERASGVTFAPEEFNARLAASLATTPMAAPSLDPAQLDAIRARRAALFAQWDAVVPGATLELPFPATWQDAP